ncbi:MAG: Hpt domain-containing protein [Myxococcales bacterium]|nr:Hpt domain-containing protein [Myxococcales bacterium]
MDDELREILVRELERYDDELSGTSTVAEARRIAHSLRGSLSLAEEREAAQAFARLERRIVAGDPRALTDLGDLVRKLLVLAREGQSLPTSAWPEPPEDLRPSAVPPELSGDYVAQARDCVRRIDAALELSDVDAALTIYREVHTLKGAALAVGDELMAWFCHGLEERLRAAKSEDAARRVLEDVRTFRGVLAEIPRAPDNALATLRLISGAPVRPSRPPLSTPLPLPPKRPSFEPRPLESDARALADDGMVRVPYATLDALLDRTSQLHQFRVPLVAFSSSLATAAEKTDDLAREVREALRLIGPPRPWGAPAAAIHKLDRAARALEPLRSVLEGASERLAALGGRVHRQTDQISSSVHSLRTGAASVLFERVGQIVKSEAKREDKLVGVQIAGGETPVDQRLIEGLVEPLRQLARNAVVHGLEPAAERVRAGKAEMGQIRLGARLHGGSVVITVEDDGAGVDTAAVRRQAVEIGLIPAEAASTLGDAALLTLLFYPGFSTRREVDLLAGRGVGLDLTLAAVHRLGGTIHLESRRGHGLTATIVVPAESGLARVLWLGAGGSTFALLVEHAGRIERARDTDKRVVPLAALVGEAAGQGAEPAFAVNVVAPWAHAGGVTVGVESIGSVDEVTLRPLPAFVRALGPWSDAVPWAEEIRLALDPLRLAQVAARRPAA